MKFFGIMLFGIFISSVTFAQKKDLRAYLDSKQFYAPGVGNYVEFYLQFVGYTLNYTGKDDGLTGELAIQMKITKDDSIVASDAYRLSTPFMKDSIIEDFYDLKRFALEPGIYKFSLSIQDLNSNNEPLINSQRMVIEDLSDAVSISDIEIAEFAYKGDENSVFYKSGYNIIPRLNTYFPEELNTIPVYFELYNTNTLADSVFAIKQTITDLMSGKELDYMTSYTKYSVAEVVPVFKKVNIERIPKGKFLLTYTLINKNMTQLSVRTYEFERNNRVDHDYVLEKIILDPAFQASIPDDSLGYFLECLIPISGRNEVSNIFDIAKSKNKNDARRYIQAYWLQTAPHNAYEEWLKYKQQVLHVEKMYGNNFQEGFETDRGRVYLQYGMPNNVIMEPNSPSEYPYEIWYYNKIGVYSNKRFVFYNPNLVNNGYRLLHSDMIGELKNPNWSYELVRRDTAPGNADDPGNNMLDQWGSKSRDRFRQF